MNILKEAGYDFSKNNNYYNKTNDRSQRSTSNVNWKDPNN